MNTKPKIDDLPRCIEATGPPPFITHRVYRWPDDSLSHWYSRHHRKGLIWREVPKPFVWTKELLRCLWMPGQLNWWIGLIFALGALGFAVGSIFTLMPELANQYLPPGLTVSGLFFAGSIPFTCAAYLQLVQAANAPPLPDEVPVSRRWQIFGWKAREIGWLSCMLQFVGTLLFNFNTLDAMLPGLNWYESDLLVWIPNFTGSILFLASGYLALIETCHKYWAWKPFHISWWVVLINFLGCIGFMISALLSIVSPGEPNAEIVQLAVCFTLQGACCFLVGALLLLPETSWQLEER